MPEIVAVDIDGELSRWGAYSNTLFEEEGSFTIGRLNQVGSVTIKVNEGGYEDQAFVLKCSPGLSLSLTNGNWGADGADLNMGQITNSGKTAYVKCTSLTSSGVYLILNQEGIQPYTGERVTFELDGIVFATNTKTHSLDANVIIRGSIQNTLDGSVINRFTTTHTIDAADVVSATKTKTKTIDAIIAARNTKTFTADGIVKATIPKTFSLDGIVSDPSAFTPVTMYFRSDKVLNSNVTGSTGNNMLTTSYEGGYYQANVDIKVEKWDTSWTQVSAQGTAPWNNFGWTSNTINYSFPGATSVTNNLKIRITIRVTQVGIGSVTDVWTTGDLGTKTLPSGTWGIHYHCLYVNGNDYGDSEDQPGTDAYFQYGGSSDSTITNFGGT